MITNKFKKQLKEIKEIDFSEWSVSFWLVKRKIAQKKANYDVLRVRTDKKLQKRFLGYLKKQLQNKDFHLALYDFNNADGDDTLFTLDTNVTDFVKVAVKIENGFNSPFAQSYDELLNSWAYISVFEKDDKKLYAWRKINSDTQPKKVRSKNAVFFQNHKLVDIEDKEVFLIDPVYDFFVYDGTTFIANKKQFESSMNFREGMKANSEEVLTDFIALNIFDNVDIIREFVGINLHHLRKLSSIKKSGYYKQSDYIQKLIRVNKKEKWDLKILDNKIIVEKETVELLLKLLNNDRLRSPINDEFFDSAAKAPVISKHT
ncbi:DUF4868 domain-containing protein [Escherichia coli]|uniref:DUF4868 domain-containing protein n=1 Tax=Escherichia coli TaxID=562 RepID=UPI0012B9E4E0|nr:DUF4868 domain-containing protein [Escherichia coli]EFH4382045.1 DUF4868 domain-containing protein [Escherichia coli]EFO0354495.1 DUF4868 domain-containing protein [Escherichia coli]EHV4542670.1 DUF4868 domain-containing protein [Escherichia coli]EIT7531167.1 DUF4868 domain-containing protein [Escherichia coli]EJC0535690.1 DUF4868 domain-containing protein [Escherichia coli]